MYTVIHTMGLWYWRQPKKVGCKVLLDWSWGSKSCGRAVHNYKFCNENKNHNGTLMTKVWMITPWYIQAGSVFGVERKIQLNILIIFIYINTIKPTYNVANRKPIQSKPTQAQLWTLRHPTSKWERISSKRTRCYRETPTSRVTGKPDEGAHRMCWSTVLKLH